MARRLDGKGTAKAIFLLMWRIIHITIMSSPVELPSRQPFHCLKDRFLEKSMCMCTLCALSGVTGLKTPRITFGLRRSVSTETALTVHHTHLHALFWSVLALPVCWALNRETKAFPASTTSLILGSAGSEVCRGVGDGRFAARVTA